MSGPGTSSTASNTVQAKGRPVYLDYQATTPLDPRVIEAMAPFFNEKFGNPHSRNHFYGWEAEEAVEKARGQIAALIGATAREIVFTSGATESNNLAIKGIARFHNKRRRQAQPGQGVQNSKYHVVTCVTEHKCVLESCAALERDGFNVTYLPVQANGLIDLNRLCDAITDDTVCVSIMGVNNEIGIIQPLADIGAICREKGVFFHTDGAQAFGKVPLDVEEMSIDLMSISGHKVYAPMGIGVLYVRRRPRVRLEAIIDGGGQEHGLRSGTLAVPLCVGLGKASEIASRDMDEEAMRLKAFRDRFLGAIMNRVSDVTVNGDWDHRIPGNINLSFSGIQAKDLMAGLRELAVSTGSACTSASVEPSYVLRALGLSDDLAQASIRIGLGRFTTEAEVDFAAEKITAEVDRLRRKNPRRIAPVA